MHYTPRPCRPWSCCHTAWYPAWPGTPDTPLRRGCKRPSRCTPWTRGIYDAADCSHRPRKYSPWCSTAPGTDCSRLCGQSLRNSAVRTPWRSPWANDRPAGVGSSRTLCTRPGCSRSRTPRPFPRFYYRNRPDRSLKKKTKMAICAIQNFKTSSHLNLLHIQRIISEYWNEILEDFNFRFEILLFENFNFNVGIFRKGNFPSQLGFYGRKYLPSELSKNLQC